MSVVTGTLECHKCTFTLNECDYYLLRQILKAPPSRVLPCDLALYPRELKPII